MLQTHAVKPPVQVDLPIGRPSAQDAVIQATVTSIVYESPERAFAVVHAERQTPPGRITLLGPISGVHEGETIRAVGRWTSHPTHGEQFQVRSYAPLMPDTATGIEKLLGSGLIQGVGPELAARIVARFGSDTLDVIATQSGRLTDVEGIGSKRAVRIAEALRSRRAEAEELAFMHSLGVGSSLARRIQKTFGESAVRILRENPYLLAERISGVGFRTADALGRAAGIADDDPRRIAAAILYVLEQRGQDGHTFSTRDEVLSSLREVAVTRTDIDEPLRSLAGKEAIALDEGRIYLRALYDAECLVAERIRGLANAPPPKITATASAATSQQNPVTLSEAQQKSVQDSLHSRIFVLTGGPGTGKTTTVRAIVQAHAAQGKRIELAAPTGRAAKRLSEATGHPARTIHRMLEWNPMTGRFARDSETPIEAELILVDESSMIDINLAARLFDAVSLTASVILVGDIDQLPPVGPGPVLRDVIGSGVVPVTRLKEIFRQAEASAIIRAAHSILNGQVPTSSPRGEKGAGEFFHIEQPAETIDAGRVVEVVARAVESYGFDPLRDVQVLSPMRRGPVGTEALNDALQRAFNPETKKHRPKPAESTSGPGQNPREFLAGDKIMQLRNDYEREVYNGDIGYVARNEGGMLFVRFDGREVQYRRDDRDALTLAYASTVHKVQGSEFPCIVVALHPSQTILLERSLVYTAVTRAKQLAVVVSDRNTFRRAVGRSESKNTNTALSQRLQVASGA